MILKFLASSNLLLKDFIYFCSFTGIVTILIYISYIVFLKEKIED